MEGVHYEVTWSSTSPCTAPWVLFLHGIGGSAFLFKELSHRFSRVFNTLCIDLPGRGLSKMYPDTPMTVIDYLNVIDSVIDKVRNDHTQGSSLFIHGIVAHSMGGVLAMYMARRNPQRVSFMVLMAPAGMMNSHWKVRLVNGLPHVVTRVFSRVIGSVFFMKHMDWPRDFENRRTLAYQHYTYVMERQAHTNPFFLQAMVNDGQNIPFTSEENEAASFPPSYDGPVLLLWGANDVVIPPSPSIGRFKRVFPQATTAVFEKTRHAFFLEAPHTTWESIETFLQGHFPELMESAGD